MSEYIKEFEESRLMFSFDNKHWTSIFQFDEHVDYKKIEKLDGTKGIDFLGYHKETVYFFEVKNFKDFRIKNKSRTNNFGEYLMIEIAQKIKDSLACIVAANKNSTNERKLWNSFLRLISSDEQNIKVVLWLETDNIADSTNVRKNNRARRNTVNLADYRRNLQSKLKWLVQTRANVLILNLSNYKSNLENLAVLSKPNSNS